MSDRWPGDSVESQVAAHLTTPPPRPSSTRPEVSQRFDPVIEKGMAKDPNERYATTVELARDAHDAVTVPSPRAQPALRASAPTLPAQSAPATPEAALSPAAETLAAAQPADPTLPATLLRGAGVPAPGAI